MPTGKIAVYGREISWQSNAGDYEHVLVFGKLVNRSEHGK